MMQLKDFISQTIQQLVEGLIEGHNSVHKSGAVVNPRLTHHDLGPTPRPGILPARGDIGKATNFIEFDVAIIGSKDAKDKGGLGIFVGAIGIGATGEESRASSQHSRIKFTIPISLPHGSSGPMEEEEDS